MVWLTDLLDRRIQRGTTSRRQTTEAAADSININEYLLLYKYSITWSENGCRVLKKVYYSTTAKSVSKRNGMAAEDATSSLETIVISVVIIYRFEV